MPLIPAEVIIDKGSSEAEADGVRAAFADAGVEASVRADYVQLSELPPWMVMALVPVTDFLTEASKDAYKKLKELISRVVS